MFNVEICKKARLCRDAKFDGKFYIAVKTTGIYCRTVCPVHSPKEENVTYFSTAIECASAGFRPCLRCRPDSAPNYYIWRGVNNKLDEALKLIESGRVLNGSVAELAELLGLTSYSLKKTFKKHLGISPRTYSLYQKCLFAKQLLHDTKLSLPHIALACGFTSTKMFKDSFSTQLRIAPKSIRKSKKNHHNTLKIKLYYRPPFDWDFMQKTLEARIIPGLEWCEKQSYGRTFQWLNCTGHFTATHCSEKNLFDVKIEISNVKYLRPIINNVKRVLDLDVDIQAVDESLIANFQSEFPHKPGIRVPGIWSMFEAGIRAILGQQISVVAARNLVTVLVKSLGEPYGEKYLFPSAQAIANSDLIFLKIPESRKKTLRNLSVHYLTTDEPDNPNGWLKLKGIGPWTVDYARMRGLSDTDVFLVGDLGVKKAMSEKNCNFNIEPAAPWGSYLTFQLWSQL
jgi:AraC family transcriptional regulator of adaptative response / DNA-3-methyladenine glycosylase II